MTNLTVMDYDTACLRFAATTPNPQVIVPFTFSDLRIGGRDVPLTVVE